MGAAAYNRGTKSLSRQIAQGDRAVEFVMMDDLNAMPKDTKAQKPWGPIDFIAGHGGWWATCPTTGYGFWYPSLRAAVRSWRVTVNAYTNGAWGAVPS